MSMTNSIQCHDHFCRTFEVSCSIQTYTKSHLWVLSERVCASWRIVRWLSCSWLVECRGSSCWYHLRFYASSLRIDPDVSAKARIGNKDGDYQRFEWRASFQRCLWKQQSLHTESHEDKRFTEWWICDAHRHGGRCSYDTKQGFTSASQERVWSLWREGLGDFFSCTAPIRHHGELHQQSVKRDLLFLSRCPHQSMETREVSILLRTGHSSDSYRHNRSNSQLTSSVQLCEASDKEGK